MRQISFILDRLDLLEEFNLFLAREEIYRVLGENSDCIGKFIAEKPVLERYRRLIDEFSLESFLLTCNAVDLLYMTSSSEPTADMRQSDFCSESSWLYSGSWLCENRAAKQRNENFIKIIKIQLLRHFL